MAVDMESLRKDVEAYLANTKMPVFRGYYRVMDATNQVSWDVDQHPDFRDFVKVAKESGAPVIMFSAETFSSDQIEEAMALLDASSLTHDERRGFETRIRQLQAYEGFTCSLDLAFSLHGQIFTFEQETDWYRAMNEILAELEAMAEVDGADEEEDNNMGSFFSKN